ncbi:carbon-nitrogen hydrolase family protein [Marinomonas posidonica]|uniref:Nitrilase/cyanide hydratase and apolipoprotein N-acyltransferase n=1 Tax=Marinomonas posidonica (strain CECT 7376 / NCIMB 14433 / IVIA-Po-181) TaxID=491952 RepID=F6CSG8_MARPP|nr:carbon-nitrogen hydrolase family protein [Marinomonas posidonica]AEF55022.1 Nitrilase/cyanide hydratase and apolipoprotein N-acyltransferase [Marinomonas posidonica IVIA-Po-181]
MESLSVAAIQLTSSNTWHENLLEVKRLVTAAAKDGARLVVLPENVFLFDGKGMRRLAESDVQQQILTDVSELAKELDIFLVIGSHPSIQTESGETISSGRVRQTLWVIGPDGSLLERYDKIHLFDVTVDDKAGSYLESEVIEPGDLLPKVVDVDGFKVGLSICYDVRFPELYRQLAEQGAELLLVPAAFTYVTGKAHWATLLAARAIENQCFVLGVNQCGWHNEKRQTYGHSSLYSPFGDKQLSLSEEPGYFVQQIHKSDLIKCRDKMPCLSHRRL